MPILGVTGGIATGKSTFTRAFLARFPVASFDADQHARDLLAIDPAVRRAVAEAFGPEIVPEGRDPDRARLRELVFASDANRLRLEGILHPEIRRRWIKQAQPYTDSNEWFVVDIPLLFETRAEAFFDRIAVVACSGRTQRERLHSLRGLSEEMAAQILAAQFDLRSKITKAHHLIWNDSTVPCLEGQAALLADCLRAANA